MANGQRGAPFGNTNGAKSKPWEQAIRKALAQRDPHQLRKIADKLIDRAEAGDDFAIREIGDRLDGKPKASTEVTGANGSALFPVTAINVVGVEPAAIVAGELERIADAEPAAE